MAIDAPIVMRLLAGPERTQSASSVWSENDQRGLENGYTSTNRFARSTAKRVHRTAAFVVSVDLLNGVFFIQACAGPHPSRQLTFPASADF
jgi:hypothetical protein